MKKLALALTTLGLLTFATPVFACPGHDDDNASEAPKTAEKDKKQDQAPAKKKDAPAKKKTDDSKKTGDKVSMK